MLVGVADGCGDAVALTFGALPTFTRSLGHTDPWREKGHRNSCVGTPDGEPTTLPGSCLPGRDPLTSTHRGEKNHVLHLLKTQELCQTNTLREREPRVP